MQKRDIKVLSVSKSTLQSLIERPKKSSGFQTGEFTGFSRRRAQLLTRGDLSDTSSDTAPLFRPATPHVASTGQVHEIGTRISKRPGD